MTKRTTQSESEVFSRPLPGSVLEGANRKKAQELGRILVELGQELSSVATPQEAARIILGASDELLGWDASAVDLLDGDEGYSLISVDTIDGKRKEFTRVYGKIHPDSMFRKVLDEGAQIILRTPKDVEQKANLRSFGDESHPSAALLFVPVRRDNRNVGMMTLQSYTFDYYDEDDLRLLQVLADYCSGCLSRTFAEVRLREAEEKRRELLSDLQERERIMNHDLALAQELQQRFLPEDFPFAGRLRCATFYRACTLVGGDLYDIFEVGPNLCGFYIADVAGHGVSAALITAILKANADRALRGIFEGRRGGSVTGREILAALPRFVSQLNNATREIVHTGGFITFQFGILDIGTGELYIVNAGHNKPVRFAGATGAVSEVETPSNIPLGLIPDYEFEVVTSRLESGDKLLMYTDGLTERLDDSSEEFGVERLVELVGKHGGESAEMLVKEIRSANDAFAADFTPDDDQAIFAIERLD